MKLPTTSRVTSNDAARLQHGDRMGLRSDMGRFNLLDNMKINLLDNIMFK
jgi:hypothetical protein